MQAIAVDVAGRLESVVAMQKFVASRALRYVFIL
jgi:hypothetical protein